FSLLVDRVAEAVALASGRDPDGAVLDQGASPSGARLVAGASMGLALGIGRFGVRAASTIGRVTAPVVTLPAKLPYVRDGIHALEERLVSLDRAWGTERARGEEHALIFIRAMLPRVIDGTINEVDLTALVVTIMEEVDLPE